MMGMFKNRLDLIPEYVVNTKHCKYLSLNYIFCLSTYKNILLNIVGGLLLLNVLLLNNVIY